MIDELQRWKDATTARLATGALKPGQIPGYLAPNPLAIVWVPNARIGDGPGSSPYKSFQAFMQIRVQQLADSSAFRGSAGPDVVNQLLGETADDAVADLGSFDPDCADRDALLALYIKLYWFAVTPV